MATMTLLAGLPRHRQAAAGRGAAAAMLMLLLALAIRSPHFGNPMIAPDEQFYLLAGDRLLHGAMPYVDLWDRKPLGLFLIYAATRLLGGAGFVQYQIVATLFAAATGLAIAAIARRVTSWIPALFAGGLYPLWIEIAEGGGGQSPVFYNLFVAVAALLTLDTVEQPDRSRARRSAFAAMALVGIAIQIKYTVLAEGLFLGLVCGGAALRRGRFAAAAWIELVLLAVVALLPTIAILVIYAASGHLHDFWFANFSSIFLRGGTDPGVIRFRCAVALSRLVPLAFCAVCAVVFLRADRRPSTGRWQLFMLGWFISALLGFFMVGVLYAHYILPIFVPLTAAAAPVFARRPLGYVLGTLAAWLPASHLGWPDFATTRRSQAELARLVALVPPDVQNRCLQVFDGPPILYYATNACAASRYMFPDHLSASIEAHAIGTDPVAEVNRLLAKRPEAITISTQDIRPPNPASFAAMRAGLRRSYRLAGQTMVEQRPIQVWILRDG